MAHAPSLIAQMIAEDWWGPVRTVLTTLLFACIAAVFIVESL